jgi:hypothetical protein
MYRSTFRKLIHYRKFAKSQSDVVWRRKGLTPKACLRK